MIFQDDFFEYEKGHIDFDELFENQFLDGEFRDRELPDSLFADMYQELKDIPGVIVLQPNVLVDMDVSRLGLVERNYAGDMEIILGPKDVETQEKIYITPDYAPAIEVLKYSFALETEHHSDKTFPDIPIAHPTIPKSAKELTPATYHLENYMSVRGAICYDPSYAFKEKHDNANFIEPCKISMMRKQVMEKLREQSFVFSSRVDISTKMKKVRFVSIQFNPFHPGASLYIDEDLRDDGRVVEGYYYWGRRREKFRFDRMSKLYRLHSDVWLGILSRESHYLGIFDLVSNFDFIGSLPGLSSILRTDYYYSSPYVIEGYYTSQPNGNPYSCMGFLREVGYFRSYAQTYPLPITINDPDIRSYNDVSDEYEVLIVEGGINPHEVNVIHKETGQNIVQIMKGRNKTRYKGSSEHFVEYSTRTGKLKVFVESPVETIHKYHRVGEMLFGSFPRNSEYSLMLPLHQISLVNFLQMRDIEEVKKMEIRSKIFQTRRRVDIEAFTSGIGENNTLDLNYEEYREFEMFDAFIKEAEPLFKH